ncbi:23S rRNA (uracil-5-)-methyltransferase RumA [Dethiosulfatibacter aminovorans DSM 17477]|uniref:23S rRNA (Uracil-5-)-methyltransferase RumA n=1 Tax=Dethiosulfatibacter aminovorans DSM 17477 TaxID=1121476 RepID=A0A1M6HTW2_9FIRM|nr:23S rRNA (uracil(1939)-C(5))-methyltransferase RlmD [Dethiosulfatibacter aminovorans]SHJ25669.1 23S rRNA (uracil-5-)-methyltransferase RumA [Dethiosulfatibacter aminovorans DSM 17477]
MKKGDIINVKITGYEFPNKGIGIYEDKKVIIKNVMPEQTVSVKIAKKRRNKIDTKIQEIVERAPYETEPVCDHFGICGGCLIQTMPYDMQLEYKKNYVKGLLDQVIEEDFEFQKIIPSPKPLEYRNKMEFSFGDEYKDGPLSLGMHMRGKFYEIVTVDTCKIVDSDFTQILIAVLEYFRGNNATFHHRGRHEGYLRHLVIRKAEKSGEILVNLVTSSQGELNHDEFKSIILDLDIKGIIKGIVNTINDSLADVVQCDEMRVLYGDTHITEELLDLKFDISPFSFFQTNSLGAEKLYSVVRDYIGETKDKTIFDLYSGTGTIAQIVAPVAKKVIGIEIIEEAVEKAKENAEFNNLSNCEFIAGDVLKKVDELEDKPDIIVLDPPRSGIHPKAIKKIIAFNPDTFIYVSCNPKALLTDIPEFIEAGYKVEKAVPVDMFPQTGHCETVLKIVRDIKG